jgi:mannose-1-phosphate guanylyltransferase/mannose-6-phosphate isomerase
MNSHTKKIVIHPIILCGGSGTRLWPSSRKTFPKQFIAFDESLSLFQKTAQRFNKIKKDYIDMNSVTVVCGEEHRFIIKEQLDDINIDTNTVILEPTSKNTAPALTLAALNAKDSKNDSVMVVVPSDHTIEDTAEFNKKIEEAIPFAENGAIVTFGIKPDKPNTGYGYIKVNPNDKNDFSEIKDFIEKPDANNARKYIESDNFYWNSGIFILKPSLWLDAMHKYSPDILKYVQKSWDDKIIDEIFIRPSLDSFKKSPEDSIDYAVIEKYVHDEAPMKMAVLNSQWSDLGSWESVWDVSQKDINGNVFSGDVISTNSRNSYVRSSGRLLALVGVTDMVVVETEDAILVANKSENQHVKEIVQKLKKTQRKECDIHLKVYRPWGWYQNTDVGDQFQVKRIMVKPGSKLSLQKHKFRSEHWVVVKGEAEVVNGDDILYLKENESTYIPAGTIHRLSNLGKTPLEIIEVQTGSYLGEDDIERFDDIYGRSSDD